MAARENQGLQIALIIFVVLTVFLIVFTFMYFKWYREEQEKGRELSARATEKESAANAAKEETREFKSLIGAAESENKEAVGTAVRKDIEQFGKGLPDTDQNLRGLVKFLVNEVNTLNTRVAELTKQSKDTLEKLEAERASHEKAIAEYLATVSKTSEDLTSERKTFKDDRDELNRTTANQSKRLGDARREADDNVKKATDRVAELKSENARLERELKELAKKHLSGEIAAEMPDGKITGIDQRTQTVWINIGSGDGLRRQTPFSVYSHEDTGLAEAKSKGKVEVIRITDRHMAEARIVNDDLSNPIMPGDLIFNPAWQPGRPEHFAIAGFIDINGDERSDLQQLRDLISHNGGVIDAELLDDGTRKGQVSIDTKYLVQGKRPTGRSSEEGTNDAVANYQDMLDEANTRGVRVVSLAAFLDYMGFKTEDRTVPLGKDARSSDFAPRLPEDTQRTLPGAGPPRDYRKPPPTSGRIQY